MGVASLRIGQDLADKVHGTLHFEGMSLFFSLYHQIGADRLHGGRNVELKRFPIGRGDQDRGLHQEPIDFVKCLLGLGLPFEAVGLLQKPIEGETSFAKARDKALNTVRHPITRCTPFMF